MARNKKATAAAENSESTPSENVNEPVNPPAETAVSTPAEQGEGKPEQKTFRQIDPFGVESILLGPTNDSPRIRLLRSNKFQQMQIKFDEKPADNHLDMLRDNGWTWRNQEKVWTIQLDKESRWKTQADAEYLFREIGNAIRAEKGLEPVQELGA